jgi:hypothetical protein
MFGRQTRKQLAQALEVITEALETAKALARRLEETEERCAEAMTLLNQSLANADTWRRLCEEAQNMPVVVESAPDFHPPNWRCVN